MAATNLDASRSFVFSRLGRFRWPENNVCWLTPSNIFPNKKVEGGGGGGRGCLFGSQHFIGGISYAKIIRRMGGDFLFFAKCFHFKLLDCSS